MMHRFRNPRQILIGTGIFLLSVSVALFVLFSPGNTVLRTYTVNDPSSKIEDKAEQQKDAEISLLFGGDVMLARTIEYPILNQNFNPFKNLTALFRKQDLVVVNLEYVAATTGTQRAGKLYTFRAHPNTLNVLTQSGVDVVSVANNHAGDYGVGAFTQMLQELHKRGIGYFGGGENVQQAYQPLYVPLKGKTIALIGFNMIEIPWFAAGESKAGIAWVDDSRITSAVKKARDKSDLIIVMPHWGWEYTAQVNEEQKRLGRLAIDAGADLVIGGHPHHIQSSEEYKSGEIFYSLGNLVFDGPGPSGWENGELVQVTLEDEQIKTQKIPYLVKQSGEVVLK